MRKIQVMVVDDSTVIRRLLSDTLVEDPEIEIATTAPNGKIALAKLAQNMPDVVTLDIEMPEMNGIETVYEIRKLYPSLPVIMFSTLTQRGAEATLDALSKGANDYVTKPANVGSMSAAMQNVRSELIPKIKGFCRWYQSAMNKPSSIPKNIVNDSKTLVQRIVPNQRIDLVAIGVSTGGPTALANVLGALPEDFPVPIAIVQHMPPIFTKHLADRLNQNCKIRVVEASDQDLLVPGTAYIARGDNHMTVRRSGAKLQLELNQQPPENSCRPAVDVLFRSIADDPKINCVAVVLTGMGQDGAKGCEAIRSTGGRILAQDEPTSVVWGMPGAVVRKALADKILPLDKISIELCFLAQLGRACFAREGATIQS